MNTASPTARILSRWHWGYVAVFAISVLAVIWRFLPWMPSVFYGDDLDYLLLFKDGGCATHASEILTTACYERFRPVASGFVLGLLNLFGDGLADYLAVNVVLQATAATLVFAVSQRMTQGNWIASLAFALVVATSRFAGYQVTQVLGPVESLTLVACLAAVYAVVRADQQASSAWRWSWVAIASVFIAVHTHERFLVAAVWLGGAFILSPGVRALGLRRWLVLFLACVAIPVFYVAYKTFVLKAHFLIGTGGTHLDPVASLIMEHTRQAGRSIFGFNTGPDYLVGASVTTAWRSAWAFAAAFSVAWACILLLGLRSAARGDGPHTGPLWDRMRWPFLLFALAAFLLVPSLLTIRLEQRWLLAPFVVVLLMAAWAAGAAQIARSRITILVVVLALASVALDAKIMQFYERVYFISSPRFAELVKRDVVDKYPQLSGGIALVAAADQCGWTLRNGGFFRVYGGKARKVECFVSIDAAAASNLAPDTHIFGAGATGAPSLVDMTAEAQAALEESGGTPLFDFLKSFAAGFINSTAKVSTPTGSGVLAMPWDSTQGVRETLTVISGFVYRYDVVVEPNSELRFGVGMLYPSAQSARAVVRAVAYDGIETVLLTRDLIPPTANAKPTFMPITLSLAGYAGKRVSISFATESPGGDPTAHWIGYSRPRIVQAASQ